MKISQELRNLLSKELPSDLEAQYPFLIIPFSRNKTAQKAANMIRDQIGFDATVIEGEDEY